MKQQRLKIVLSIIIFGASYLNSFSANSYHLNRLLTGDASDTIATEKTLTKQSLSRMAEDSVHINIKRLFIRIFDSKNRKTDKGFLTGISAYSLKLEHELKDTTRIIHYSQIEKIKTKRSSGANYLLGSVVGVSLGFSLIVGDPDFGFPSVYSGPERIAAISGGLMAGFLGGIFYDLFKKREVYRIEGNHENFLKLFQELSMANQVEILTE